MARKNEGAKHDASLLATLRLIRTYGVGPLTYHRLLAHAGGDPVQALKLAPELASKCGKPLTLAPQSVAEKEIEIAHKNGCFLLSIHDPDYPDALQQIEDAPPILHCMGQKGVLKRNRPLAVVGARNASAHARQWTKRACREVSAKGVTVISGFAAGIDRAAHEGSMETGTIAVLGGGLGKPYPKDNIPLMEPVAETGILLSECPWDEAPTAQHFPRRNRIVSGLSKAVLVVEAASRSGSLITARLAAEQGRDVLAVPGFPDDPRATGPNRLIRDGAILITEVQDILDALEEPTLPRQPALFEGPQAPLEVDTYEESANENGAVPLMDFLSSTPIAVDDLAAQCHISVQQVQRALLEMELAGRITRYPGNRVARGASAS